MSHNKSLRPTTQSSEANNNLDINDLTSAFGNLTSNDHAAETGINPKQEQAQPKWNHETRAATLNARKIHIPQPKGPIFFGPNINANIYQKQTIARKYYERREVEIELANPPDPKTLINPADLAPKVDPKIQAQRDAFTAKYDQASYNERMKAVHLLKKKKSDKDLARREEAFRKGGRFI